MNCKPGDKALIIGGAVKENHFKVVVVGELPKPYFNMGFRFVKVDNIPYIMQEVDSWLVTSEGPPLFSQSFVEGTLEPVKRRPYADRYLMSLRDIPDDEKDTFYEGIPKFNVEEIIRQKITTVV